jgi:Putative metallopeptidase
MYLSRLSSLLIIAAAITGLTLMVCQRAIAVSDAERANAEKLASQEARPNRIQFEYVTPQNPQHERVYTQVKEARALEKIQQLFNPFRLPMDLTVKTIGCDGRSNAWYQRPALTLCYEYLDEIWQSAPKEVGPAGITPIDAVAGQFFYVVAHEFGHAIFDLLQVPSFGSAEDAADQFSTYVMLHMGKDDARRLISGAAYSYRNALQSAAIVPLQAFSDMHSMPAQRFYNLLCIAYGADPTTFAHVVEEKYLPEGRARDCKREYDEVAFAFNKLLGPHLDQELVKQTLNKEWLPPESPKPVRN